MNSEWVQSFIDALHGLEDRNEVEPLVAQFAPEAGLWTLVRTEPVHGTEAIREFWQGYRNFFERIHSTFERIIETEDQAALEWRAEGTLSQGGRELAYRGVTILKRKEEGITEFASYYDPQPFLERLDIRPVRAAA